MAFSPLPVFFPPYLFRSLFYSRRAEFFRWPQAIGKIKPGI
jgi:hypothetical protein